MKIPIPVIITIFLGGAVVGACYGASWYSVLGVASPGIMAAMLMFQEWRGKRRQGVKHDRG